MSGKYLLDTNIIIALFANETAVVKNLTRAKEVFLPSIVVGELFYGAKKSRRVEENTAVCISIWYSQRINSLSYIQSPFKRT